MMKEVSRHVNSCPAARGCRVPFCELSKAAIATHTKQCRAGEKCANCKSSEVVTDCKIISIYYIFLVKLFSRFEKLNKCFLIIFFADSMPVWLMDSDLKEVQTQWIRLIHAHRTEKTRCRSSGHYGPFCTDLYCKETKDLLQHIALCENFVDCRVILFFHSDI